MTLIVLDAANVTTVSIGDLRIERLMSAIEYFTRLGLCCIAFAPRYWLDSTLFNDDRSRDIIQSLVQQETMVLTPPQAHDDYYIIDYAMKNDGYIITNDLFRDHVLEKRQFDGKSLTTNWIKSHCIDFIFVGKEFLPNSQKIESIRDKTRSASVATSAEIQTLSSGTSNTPFVSSILNSVNRSIDSGYEMANDGGGDDDGNMKIDDEMMNSANTIRVVDMSESVYIQVPMEIVQLFHENNDAGLRYFQDMSGTYMTLPTNILPGNITTTLSIFGSRENCEIAMHSVHAFLNDYYTTRNAESSVSYQQSLMQQQQQHHHHQQQQPQHHDPYKM